MKNGKAVRSMPAEGKKQIIMNILEILRRYSDEEHRLSQKEIVDLLRTKYDLIVERKTVRRNLLTLMDCGYEIEFNRAVRTVPNRVTGEPEESELWTDFYLVRDFTDSELRLLIDGVLCSGHIPCNQGRELVGKLERLSSDYFSARVKHVRTVTDSAPLNKQLFHTIGVLDEAISRKRRVAFRYLSFGLDKKLHPRLAEDGSEKLYTVNPCRMAAANGCYYLICSTEPHDNVSHYRLDRIAEIRLLDEPVRVIPELRYGVDLPRYMAEHLYMFSGGSEVVTFRMKQNILNDVMDRFGTDVAFSDEGDDDVTARVTVNRTAMCLWAIQYAPYVTVLSPKTLAEEVKQALEKALERYRKEENKGEYTNG